MNKKTRSVLFIISVLFAVCILVYLYLNDNKANIVDTFVSDDYVEFFNVGQGDCALISSNGRNCLIDTGTASSVSSLMDKLNEQNITNIDLISLSHFHVDHTGGVYDIVKELSVDNLLYPKELRDSDIPKAVLNAKIECLAEDGDFFVARAGQTVDLGDFKLSVLYQNIKSNDENNRSVYIMAKIGDVKFLFTGDGEKESEKELIMQNLNIDCDVLKVPHHGGSNSSSAEFLSECDPQYAVISCGKDNMYGHPHKETMERLKEQKAKIYRTDKDGDIVFFVSGDNKISVNTYK